LFLLQPLHGENRHFGNILNYVKVNGIADDREHRKELVAAFVAERAGRRKFHLTYNGLPNVADIINQGCHAAVRFVTLHARFSRVKIKSRLRVCNNTVVSK